MVKGGKRYSSMGDDGKWFAHSVVPENETRNRETCTSTGIMLTQVKSSLPQMLNLERYPKWKTQQDSREFPFSDHDNKHSLRNSISVFGQGVGRRKCFDHRRQHISHFCLCHDNGSEETKGHVTVYQADFKEKQATFCGPSGNNRRFPHNHQLKSAKAAAARAGEQFMWFGRYDYSAPAKPEGGPYNPGINERGHGVEEGGGWAGELSGECLQGLHRTMTAKSEQERAANLHELSVGPTSRAAQRSNCVG
ncbi:testis-expressed protein 36 [Brachionichthys hirsutus]|uniref:testis-expressed protein 36 n=1 Tax=Brachionichthys hirsutus TaxID=412623 RepID=UPI00360538E1